MRPNPGRPRGQNLHRDNKKLDRQKEKNDSVIKQQIKNNSKLKSVILIISQVFCMIVAQDEICLITF